MQSISFTTSPSAAVVGGSYSVGASASSGLPVRFSVAATSAGVCSVSGTAVAFVGTGTCTIRANQAGNTSYRAAPQVTQSFAVVVAVAVQTISFSSTPPSGALVGGSTYHVTAEATSGLPVEFGAEGDSAGICTVTGSTVAFVGVGTCTILADQAGNGSYHPAPRVRQSFSIGTDAVSLSVQSISFTSTPPSSATVGGSYVIAATASSGLPVTYSAAPSSAGVCTVSGSTVSLVGQGTCTVRANQVGNASYLPAPQVQQGFLVGLVAQTITFSTTPPVGAVVGDPDYTVAATSSSGLPVVFSANPSSAGVCTVSGSTVSMTGVGTCTVDTDQPGNATFGPAPQVQQSFGVVSGTPSLSVQSISFTSSPPTGATVGGTPYTVSASASSGLVVSFSAAPASSGVCTVAGSTVSFVGTGTCVVRADQAGNASYEPAPQVSQSFAVGLAPQTISFTSTPPGGPVVGDPAYTVTATSSSGLPVAFSAGAGSAGVCTVSGSTVTFVGAGTCTIDADQAGNAVYQAAPQVQQSFTIDGPPAPSVQSISFTSSPPSGATVGGPAYTVSASASSGLAVTFSASPGSAGVCTVSGSTVSFVGSGTCVVLADQAGNASYEAAPQISQSFGVGLLPQTISFTSTPPPSADLGDPDYVVAATATSGLAVTFSIDPASAGICSVSGSTVSFVGAGTCIVRADQPGNAAYEAAPQVLQSFTINGPPPSLSVQSISFTSSPPSGALVGGPAYTVSASASSGLAVTFSASPASAGVCTVSGSTVSLVGAGTCTILADQAGDASYEPAPQVSQSFTVGLTPQAISFTSTPPASATVGDPDYLVTATATSGLAVAFSAAASSAGVCTVSGSTVSFLGAGTCTIDADQAGDATHEPAAQVQQSFTVSPAPAPSVQSIDFTSSPPAGAVVGGPAYVVSASASSGLPVSFSVDPASAGVCTLSGATVSFVGAGTCTIRANQAGNASYEPAPQVQQSFVVNLAGQTVSFTSTPPGAAFTGGPTYTVSATASSGLAVGFSIAPASSGVCSVSGSTVSFLAAGTCTVLANQAGNGAYAAAPQVSQSFAVALGPQTISFTSTAPSGAYVGGPTYTVAATASSGLAVSFSSGSPSVCTVSGSTVSFVGTGTCVVRANQPGNGSYEPAPQLQQSFTVIPPPSPQTITFTSSAPASAVYLGPNYNVTATASSGLPVTFTVSGTCTLSGSFTVVMAAAGSCTVYADQSGNSAFFAAPQVQQTFTIAKRPQTITFPDPGPQDEDWPPFGLFATASSGLAVTYTLDPTSVGVCSLSGSTVTPIDNGDCDVYANQAGDANYLPAPQVYLRIKIRNNVNP